MAVKPYFSADDGEVLFQIRHRAGADDDDASPNRFGAGNKRRKTKRNRKFGFRRRDDD